VIGGQISGLKGKIILQNNNGDLLATNTDGLYDFSQSLNQGDQYAVTVKQQPANQTCSITNSVGTIGRTSKNNINVFCAIKSYLISGTLEGASDTVQVYLNGIQPLALTQNGSFNFPTKIAGGTPYSVTATCSTQTCTVSNGSGTVDGNVNNIVITSSSTSYTVGGSVSGLDGKLDLTLNDTNPLSIGTDGTYVFETPLADGSYYQAKIDNQPENQTCTFATGTDSGTISGADVTNVDVQCVTEITTISLDSTGVIPVSSDGSQSVSINVKNEDYNYNAVNVSIKLPSSWIGVTQDATACALVAPGDSCSIILRSTVPYVALGGLEVSGDNTNVILMSLGFSLNEYLVWSTPSSSSVLVLDTKSGREPWSPTGSVEVTGVSDASTAEDDSCLGPTDGRCNTKRIFDTFDTLQLEQEYDAGVCYTRTSDTTGDVPAGTWYLPAACELTNTPFYQYPPWSCVDINGGSTANIASNLFDLGFLPEAELIDYYSSTNSSDDIYYSYAAKFNYNGTGLGITNNQIYEHFYCVREIALS